MTLTRSRFDQLTADLVERTRGPVEQALSDAKLTADDVDEVILVGGSTRMPAVQELVRRMTGGKDPNMTVNPDEVVALGAALQAGVLKGEVEDVVLLDVTAAVAGTGDAGWRDDEGDRAQHHDPGPPHGDVLDRRGQPDGGRRRRPPGRARAGRRQPPARPASGWRGSHRPPADPADRGHVRRRRQRHPQRLGTRQGDRQGAAGHDLRELEPGQGRCGGDDPAGRGPRGRGSPASRGDRCSQRARLARLSGRAAR